MKAKKVTLRMPQDVYEALKEMKRNTGIAIADLVILAILDNTADRKKKEFTAVDYLEASLKGLLHSEPLADYLRKECSIESPEKLLEKRQ